MFTFLEEVVSKTTSYKGHGLKSLLVYLTHYVKVAILRIQSTRKLFTAFRKLQNQIQLNRKHFPTNYRNQTLWLIWSLEEMRVMVLKMDTAQS